MTVGIDGGYVKAQDGEQGCFEGIAGKSLLAFRRGESRPPRPTSALPLSRPMTRSPNAGYSSCSSPRAFR